jgi:hypothetical protein
MIKSLVLWKGIFANPIEGFKQVAPETKVGFPIMAILLLSIAAGALLIPIVTSQAFVDTQFRLVVKMTESQGNQMGEAQKQGMEQGMKSDTGKIVSALQYSLQYVIAGLIGIFLGALTLFVVGKILKAQIDFGKALRVVVFSYVIIVLGLLIKGGLVLLSDWKSALSNMESIMDMQYVITTDISLGAFFTSATIGKIPLYIISFVTDIFNIGFTLFVAAGLTALCEIKFVKAVIAGVFLSVIPFVIGLVSILAVPA